MSLYSPFSALLEKTRLQFQKRVKDGQLAVLGDTDGAGARVEVPGLPGKVYARYPGPPDANGFATYSPPFIVRAGNAAFPNYPGASVYVAYGYNQELEIVSANFQQLDQAGVDTRTLNPLHQQSKWVYPWQLTIALCSAVANSVTSSFLVTVKKFRHYTGNVFATFETGLAADKVDLESYIPATDMHCYAAVWIDLYANVAEVVSSTPQSLFTPLDETDIQECVDNAPGRPPDAVALKLFYLSNDQGSITQKSASDVDVRQFLNMPQVWGFPTNLTTRERVRPGYTLVTAPYETSGNGDLTVESGGRVVIKAIDNLSATTDPTVNDDADDGYTVDSVWVNTSTPAWFVLLDPTPGAAVWLQMGSGSSAANLKALVNAVAATALPAVTYANGTAGVGATLTKNTAGVLTVDGVPFLLTGMRVLIAGQASTFQNGIYELTTVGSIFVPFVLTRATDFDEPAEIPNALVPVLAGTIYGRTWWYGLNSNPPTIGTDSIDFVVRVYAPDDATYIVQTPSSSLSAEQAMSALATGLVKNTTATGVQSIAAKTDIDTTIGSQTQNRVYASPNGSSGTPDFRALVQADLPQAIFAPVSTFRLSLANTANALSDVSGASTIYLVNWFGNRIDLYDGTNWDMLAPSNAGSISFPVSQTISSTTTNADATVTVANTALLSPGMTVTGTGISGGTTILSITNATTFELSANATASATNTLTYAIPANKMFDVFGYKSSTSLLLGVRIWTNDTARATALTVQDGVPVLTGNTSWMHLGTARTDGSSQLNDFGTGAPVKRTVSNTYNQRAREVKFLIATNTYAYASATIRQMDGSAANQVEVVAGLGDMSFIHLNAKLMCNVAGTVAVGIGVDTTTAFTSGNIGMSNNATGGLLVSDFDALVPVGYHVYSGNEKGSAGNTFSGDQNNPAFFQAGVTGWVMC